MQRSDNSESLPFEANEGPVGEIGIATDNNADTLPRNAQSKVPLSGVIQSRSSFIVAAYCEDFKSAFGFSPDQCIDADGEAGSIGCVSEHLFLIKNSIRGEKR